MYFLLDSIGDALFGRVSNQYGSMDGLQIVLHEALSDGTASSRFERKGTISE